MIIHKDSGEGSGSCCCQGSSPPGNYPFCDCADVDDPTGSLCWALRGIEFIDGNGDWTEWYGLTSVSPTFHPPPDVSPIIGWLIPENNGTPCVDSSGTNIFILKQRCYALFLYVQVCCVDNDHWSLDVEATVGPGTIFCPALGLGQCHSNNPFDPFEPDPIACNFCSNVTAANANFEIVGQEFHINCDQTLNGESENYAYDQTITVPSVDGRCDCVFKFRLTAHWVTTLYGGSCTDPLGNGDTC